MDITFKRDDKWFRMRACGIIYRDDKILMCKNLDFDLYYSVGGGVEHGESVEDAVRREVFEETGQRLEIDRLLFIHQNFFVDKFAFPDEKVDCHEMAFYYLMKDNGEDLVRVGETSLGAKEKTEWLSRQDFKEKTVYPNFLFEKLDNKEVEIIKTIE